MNCNVTNLVHIWQLDEHDSGRQAAEEDAHKLPDDEHERDVQSDDAAR